ncbi:hypothetical protein [Halopiger djelfimassiliensis]|uniref:hypothetical protein n=1 Tax=Halopiger djelfimassiliensis TaxID=1293047 RepID=UPI0006782EB2|nr:hypothetical protein [Halopiger djelfimassiliensis]
MTERDTGSETRRDQLFDRRTYLKGVAGVGATIAASMGAAAQSGDYEEVVVGANQSVTYTVGSGETLENLLIDISAHNAKFYIRANGSDWAVRNIGIRGTWDDDTKEEPFIVNVTAGGTGVVENFYWADGTAPFDSQRTYGGAATGCYVANSHAGTLIMENMNLQGFSDNGVYGSSPGDLSSHPSGGGGGGEVIIRNSYAADCAPAGFRLGSDGSRLENCVVTNCTRNYWGFYHDTAVVDCDLSDSSQHGDIVVSDSYWDHAATVTARNTYFETTGKHGSNGRVVGSSADRTPRTKPDQVEGVPLTPEEAAAGTSSADPSPPTNGDEDDGTDDDGEVSEDAHLLAFVTESDARLAEYEFTAEGPVEFATAPYESPSGGSIEGSSSNDYIESDNGTYRAGGATGGGYGDAFHVDGPVTAIDLDQPDAMWIELDGEEMTVEEVIEATAEEEDDQQDDDAEDTSNLLAFVTESDARLAEYEFTAEGPVEFATAPYESPSGGSIEGSSSNDYIESDNGTYRAGGATGGGYGDAFRVDGPVTAIDLDQPDAMWIELDGEEMTAEEVIEATSGEDDREDRPSHAIVIDGTESDEPVSYSFKVSGSIEKSTYRDASIDDDDIIDGNEIEGTVRNSTDTYWFSGDIVDFWLNGNARVDVEYDARE